jgi:hypothetical protein
MPCQCNHFGAYEEPDVSKIIPNKIAQIATPKAGVKSQKKTAPKGGRSQGRMLAREGQLTAI